MSDIPHNMWVHWDYPLPTEGPFRVLLTRSRANPLPVWWRYETAAEAFDGFVRHCLSGQRAICAQVQGPAGEVVVGFATSPKYGRIWLGTQDGFHVLAAHPDVEQVDAAFWEMQAQGQVPLGVEL